MSSSYDNRDSEDDKCDQRMRKINRRKNRYKRSTNNSHKKFICIAKKLLFQYFTPEEQQDFISKFDVHRHSRTYYFILLSHIKQKLNPQQKTFIHDHFNRLLNQKVQQYSKEIGKTSNTNFVNFRHDQIEDIQFALKSFDLYLEGRFEESIQAIYKKNRNFVIKKKNFQQTLYFMLQLEKTFNPNYNGGLNDYFLSKEKSSSGNSQICKLQHEGEEITNKSKKLDMKGKRNYKKHQIDDESWSQTLKKNCKIKSKNLRNRKSQTHQKRIQAVNIIPKVEQPQNYPLLHLQASYPFCPQVFSNAYSFENEIKHPNPYKSPYQPLNHPVLRQNYGCPSAELNGRVIAISNMKNEEEIVKAQIVDSEIQQ